ARERQVLPGPGLGLLVARKAVELGRERTGAPRRTQPHVDLVEHAVIGLRGQRADQTLGHAREILRAIEAARPVRFRLIGVEVVDDDQIEIRGRGHLAPAELAERQDRGFLPRYPSMGLGEVLLDRPVQRADQCIREARERLARLLRRYRAGENAGADEEDLFLREDADAVEEILLPAGN